MTRMRETAHLEALGRLAGGVAHDFNNLLTSILGSAEMLMDQLAPDAPGRRDVEEIIRAADSAALLTRQLLAFGRRQMLTPQAVSLETLLGEMHEMLRRLIREDVELTVWFGQKIHRVYVDPVQVNRIVLNLVSNARDAIAGRGHIDIQVANADLDDAYVARHPDAVVGPHVMLAVTDTGQGMDPATASRIFEPFFTTKAFGDGFGLGLATVYGIVRQSKGSISVYSEPGRGTTFKVYLPAVDDPGAAPPPQPAAATEGALNGRETLALVEDQADLRRLTRRILERYGYVVRDYSRGDEAIEALERGDGIDLLLTDVVLPGASGREVAAAFERRHASSPVLYMTGYTEDAMLHGGMLQPGVNLIEKPFTATQLVRQVRALLEGPVRLRP